MAEGSRRGRRPRVDGEVASERIWAWLTPSERSALERVSEDTDTPIAVIIREAVNVFVAEFGERQVFSDTGKSRPCPILTSVKRNRVADVLSRI